MKVFSNYTKMIPIVLVMALIFSSCSKDKDSKLRKTYDSGDYDKAFAMATELSKKSDPEAFLYLGLMHDIGEGVPENKDLALKYYSRAAELGDSYAMRHLGEISYKKGQHKEAFEWFNKSADKENQRAYLRLIKIYRSGEGVEKNDEAAGLWLNKAIAAYKIDADKGDPDAALVLSEIYKDEKLSAKEKNDQTSKSWLTIAVSGYKKKVDQRDYKGALSLANIYSDGLLAPQDFKEEYKWLKEGAELGSSQAQFRVASEYYTGKNMPKDLTAAVQWYTKAAENNVVDAQEILAMIYFDKRNGMMDSKKAFEWANKVGDRGEAPTQLILADCYINGKGVERNLQLGVEWLKKAAAQGDAQAKALLRSVEKQIAAQERRRAEEAKYAPKAADIADAEWLEFRNNEKSNTGKITTWKLRFDRTNIRSAIFGGEVIDRLCYLNDNLRREVELSTNYTTDAYTAWEKAGDIADKDWVVVTGKFEYVTTDGAISMTPIRVKRLGYSD